MQAADQTAPISKGALWTGRVLSGLVILLWGGLYLRDLRLRALIPFRQ